MLLAISNGWWEGLTGAGQAFWGISIVFSVLFVIQFVLSLIGVDFDLDMDGDVDTDFGMDADFSLFSIRSIIAFFTFFGWTGVLVLGAGFGVWTAIISASLSGFLAMVIVGYMMYKFTKFDESGTFNPNSAINHIGEVYLFIPPAKAGYGKIHLKMKSGLKEMDAVTDEAHEIPTGAKIKVIEVLDDNLLLVEKIIKN